MTKGAAMQSTMQQIQAVIITKTSENVGGRVLDFSIMGKHVLKYMFTPLVVIKSDSEITIQVASADI